MGKFKRNGNGKNKSSPLKRERRNRSGRRNPDSGASPSPFDIDKFKADNNGLTFKEYKFCLEYLKDFNGARAAREAGYNDGSADTIASMMLRKVKIQKQLGILLGDKLEVMKATPDKAIRENLNIAFADLSDYINDRGELNIAEIKKMPRDLTSAIRYLTQTKKYDKKGNHIGTTTRLGLWDKGKALDKLFRYHSLYKDVVKVEEKKEVKITWDKIADVIGENAFEKLSRRLLAESDDWGGQPPANS